MDGMAASHRITDEAALIALYGAPSPAALTKEVDHLHKHYRAMIAASPFVVLATSGPGGLDATPRGDPAGFVAIEDDRTLLIPDRRGNNRLDSLRNLLTDPRIALLFLIPGVGETLRVNGRAEISIDPALLARFPMQGKLPRSVIVVHVETGVFPVPEGAGAVRAVEPGEADRPQGSAQHRNDPGRYQPRRGGRGAVRPRISGPAEGDDLLERVHRALVSA